MALEDPTKSTLFSSLLILLSYFLVKVSCDFTADVSKQMKSAEVDQLRHLCFRIVSRYLLKNRQPTGRRAEQGRSHMMA